MIGALEGIRVLDLTRILAGPTATQLFGDLGADIIKVERPGSGDDTRGWGPPFLEDSDGRQTRESAYFMCTNRNKRSVAIDITKPEGQQIIRKLVKSCDVFMENFKVGGLAKYGLAYDDLKGEFPGLVYCSITGFGQDGPYAKRAGYDFMIQAMSGLMGVTGETDGMPMKVGVATADVMTGMYASTAILAALRHKDRTGQGQFIDLALLDSQMAALINVAAGHLVSEEEPKRYGNAHPNIVPYRAYQTADSYIILAVGNDTQFRAWATLAGSGELADDARFCDNESRVRNREALEPLVEKAMLSRTRDDWISELARLGVPCGPVNSVSEAFSDPQARHRGTSVEFQHPANPDQPLRLVGNPIKMSQTPVRYAAPPPMLGQHTDEVLADVAELSDSEIVALRDGDIVA